jgi:two-component system, OmpR family, sensor histidine kinase KdpD
MELAMTLRRTGRDGLWRPVDAAFVLPIGYLGLLLIGVVAVATNGRLGAPSILAAACVLVGTLAAVTTPAAAVPLAALGWFTVAGFAHTPFGELHPSGTGPAALILAAVTVSGAATGVAARRWGHTSHRRPTARPVRTADRGGTLDDVVAERLWARRSATRTAVRGRSHVTPHTAQSAAGLSRRRVIVAFVLAAVLLPTLTVLLTMLRSRLALVDELMLYLLAVVVITLVGGFWPAVLAAISAGLLINWYFTPPLHMWSIEAPTNILALLLFVATAVTVSSVVHLAARRTAVAEQRATEADALLALARTVLGGEDTPAAILHHLSATFDLTGELQEFVAGRWIRVAGASSAGETRVIAAGPDLRLLVYGDLEAVSTRIVDGFAAQAAAAHERHRLRIQAGQTEALAAANRMRTALLAAVSHDLRTPLSSVKASVSSLRQEDVDWSDSDRSALLATIEDGADQLAALIANLLDMSRIHTGAVQPFLRPVALDELMPVLTRDLGGTPITVDIPDDLPLLNTDPVLLERALANLLANSLRFSPRDRPPTVSARRRLDGAAIEVLITDHGPGIPADQREQAFEPFQQLGDRRPAAGVGLGLAVAKGFVEALGGQIAAQSTPGGGLTMRVVLPTPVPERTTSVGAP